MRGGPIKRRRAGVAFEAKLSRPGTSRESVGASTRSSPRIRRGNSAGTAMRSFGAVVLIVSALAGVAVGVWSPVSEGRRVKAAASASYPSTPFALPSLVTMLARGGGNSVWVGRIGSVDRLAAHPDGTLTQVEALDVGAGSRPSAMVQADQNCDQYRFVLQAQNDVLEVF